ncbi:MAG: 4-hydroxybenzoate polyprenyltransferase [Candidatus Endobugula sp.]|jgi:4-hydroxybenzoate polyprenyltransferase
MRIPFSTLRHYWELMRFHHPIGILLLLWPTYWALWLAAKGMPDWNLLIIFTLGVIVMRAAGCVINDIADRNIDGRVQRTQTRPLVTGSVTIKAALGLFLGLALCAFMLVLLTNTLTIYLSLIAVALAFCYPFMKRHTHLPQVVLGAAFSMSIPMAFAAQTGELDPALWVLYITNVLWTVSYDTFYGMADREYDKQIGVKSTAILFAENDRIIIASIQLLTLVGWIMVGNRFELGSVYFICLSIAALFMAYQQWLIRYRQPAACLQAFMNNHWVGLWVFIGIAIHFLSP